MIPHQVATVIYRCNTDFYVSKTMRMAVVDQLWKMYVGPLCELFCSTRGVLSCNFCRHTNQRAAVLVNLKKTVVQVRRGSCDVKPKLAVKLITVNHCWQLLKCQIII